MTMYWNRKFEVVGQVLIWLLLFGLSLSFLLEMTSPAKAFSLSLKGVFLLMVVAYWNSLFLLPRYFLRNQFGWYFFSVGLTLMGLLSLNYWLAEWPIFQRPPREAVLLWQDVPVEQLAQRRRPFFFPPFFFSMLGVLFFSTVYTLAKVFWQKQTLQQQLEQDRTQYELNFLRSQINPHFLFNALNNLNATIRLRPAKAQDFLLRLSDLLRYILEYGKDERITLQQEIQYLEHYLFFQGQKDESFTNISLHIEEGTEQGLQLEPMLFLPLVENAFVHSYRTEASERWVYIQLFCQNGELSFTVENNLSDTAGAQVSAQDRTGLGLQNVRRRLEILYPDQYRLSYGVKEDRFQLHLNLQLYEN